MVGCASWLINAGKHFLYVCFEFHIFEGEAIDITLYALVFFLLHYVFPQWKFV